MRSLAPGAFRSTIQVVLWHPGNQAPGAHMERLAGLRPLFGVCPSHGFALNGAVNGLFAVKDASSVRSGGRLTGSRLSTCKESVGRRFFFFLVLQGEAFVPPQEGLAIDRLSLTPLCGSLLAFMGQFQVHSVGLPIVLSNLRQGAQSALDADKIKKFDAFIDDGLFKRFQLDKSILDAFVLHLSRFILMGDE